MAKSGVDLLFVGPRFNSDQIAVFKHLGIRCHFVNCCGSARQVLDSACLDVVLIARQLADGSGLHFAITLEGQNVSAFVSLPVEERCLWLPVIDQGGLSIGCEPLTPDQLVRTIHDLASMRTGASGSRSRKDTELEWLLYLASARSANSGQAEDGAPARDSFEIARQKFFECA